MSSHSSLAPGQSATSEPVTLPDTAAVTNPDTPAPFLITCPDCEGAGQHSVGHPMDPYARSYDCDLCEGSGEVVPGCQCCACNAVEMFDGMHLCASCAAEQRKDAADARLDRIEALLTWCREHVRPPPANLLYDAVGALESLRRAA